MRSLGRPISQLSARLSENLQFQLVLELAYSGPAYLAPSLLMQRVEVRVNTCTRNDSGTGIFRVYANAIRSEKFRELVSRN
jgi:hypothetical protein